MKEGESRLSPAKRPGIGMIDAIVGMECTCDKELYLLVTGGWHFQTGRDCPNENVRSDFEVWEGRNTGSFR